MSKDVWVSLRGLTGYDHNTWSFRSRILGTLLDEGDGRGAKLLIGMIDRNLQFGTREMIKAGGPRKIRRWFDLDHVSNTSLGDETTKSETYGIKSVDHLRGWPAVGRER